MGGLLSHILRLILVLTLVLTQALTRLCFVGALFNHLCSTLAPVRRRFFAGNEVLEVFVIILILTLILILILTLILTLTLTKRPHLWPS